MTIQQLLNIIQNAHYIKPSFGDYYIYSNQGVAIVNRDQKGKSVSYVANENGAQYQLLFEEQAKVQHAIDMRIKDLNLTKLMSVQIQNKK